ncbi:unnamed protein product [[Candida] boidinii]|nr:unnamed protein product [[Candida] boidinii]
MSPLKLHEIPNHKINDSTEALLPSSEYKETNHKNDDTNNKEFKKSEFPININSNNNSEFSMPETEYISNSNYPSIISSPNTNFTNSKISQAFESFLIFNESLYKVERLMSRFPYRQKKFTSNDLDIIKRDDKEEEEEEEKKKTKEKEIEMKEKEDALRKEMEIEFELRKEMEEKIDKEVKEELSKEKEKIAQKEKEDAKKKEEETEKEKEKEKEKEEENEKDKEVKDKDESAVKDKQKEQDDKSNEDIKEKEEEKTELSNLKKISANPEDGKSDNNEPIIDSEQKISKEALKDEYLEKLKDLKNSKESLNDSEKNIFQMWVKINGDYIQVLKNIKMKLKKILKIYLKF